MPVTLKVDTVKSDCREESTVFQLGMYMYMYIVDNARDEMHGRVYPNDVM